MLLTASVGRKRTRMADHRDHPPILQIHDGGHGDGMITGRDALEEIFDVIRRALPRIPLDDPVRPHLAEIAPVLCEQLGRPRIVAVSGTEQ